MTERIRLTITVTPDVHATFTRMAEVSNMSLGRCMGEWLSDTLEGAQFVAQKMEDARRSPTLVMRELHAMSLGLVDESTRELEHVRAIYSGAAAAGRSAGAAGTRPTPSALRRAPPSSNTGVKVAQKAKAKGAKS